jgi:hypothetical protein
MRLACSWRGQAHVAFGDAHFITAEETRAMASVRGILNIQSLIELSSENLFYIDVDCILFAHIL